MLYWYSEVSSGVVINSQAEGIVRVIAALAR